MWLQVLPGNILKTYYMCISSDNCNEFMVEALPFSQEVSYSSLIETFLFIEELSNALRVTLQQVILHQVIDPLQK